MLTSRNNLTILKFDTKYMFWTKQKSIKWNQIYATQIFRRRILENKFFWSKLFFFFTWKDRIGLRDVGQYIFCNTANNFIINRREREQFLWIILKEIQNFHFNLSIDITPLPFFQIQNVNPIKKQKNNSKQRYVFEWITNFLF